MWGYSTFYQKMVYYLTQLIVRLLMLQIGVMNFVRVNFDEVTIMVDASVRGCYYTKAALKSWSRTRQSQHLFKDENYRSYRLRYICFFIHYSFHIQTIYF
jgi:uncharacterized membrane protein YkgB